MCVIPTECMCVHHMNLIINKYYFSKQQSQPDNSCVCPVAVVLHAEDSHMTVQFLCLCLLILVITAHFLLTTSAFRLRLNHLYTIAGQAQKQVY